MPAKAKPPQVPSSPPIRVEVRIDGRIRFAQACYEPQLSMTDDGVTFTAALNPTLIDAPAPRPREEFGSDPRDGAEVIQQVHSGRRTYR